MSNDTRHGGGLDGLSFDPEALREKYQMERDRRLRADGTAQCGGIAGQAITGRFFSTLLPDVARRDRITFVIPSIANVIA